MKKIFVIFLLLRWEIPQAAVVACASEARLQIVLCCFVLHPRQNGHPRKWSALNHNLVLLWRRKATHISCMHAVALLWGSRSTSGYVMNLKKMPAGAINKNYSDVMIHISDEPRRYYMSPEDIKATGNHIFSSCICTHSEWSVRRSLPGTEQTSSNRWSRNIVSAGGGSRRWH